MYAIETGRRMTPKSCSTIPCPEANVTMVTEAPASITTT